MIWLLTSTLFIVGMILFGLGYRENERRPPALKLHLLNEEVVGTIFMVLAIWTVGIYALVKLI